MAGADAAGGAAPQRPPLAPDSQRPSLARSPQRPPLALIAAVARNGVIGDGERMPWHLPEDLAHFRRVTMGCPVVMGRRTWDSVPLRFRPLPGRSNIVVSRDAGWAGEGAQRAGSLDEALRLARAAAATTEPPAPRIFVIGGGQLYAQAIAAADELFLTEIDIEAEGSVRFPAWDRERYERVGHEKLSSAAGCTLAFNHYRRRVSCADPPPCRPAPGAGD